MSGTGMAGDFLARFSGVPSRFVVTTLLPQGNKVPWPVLSSVKLSPPSAR